MLRIASRYRVLGVLGTGSAGTAFRVHDEVRDHVVSLKRLTVDGRAADGPLLAASLRREFTVLRGLNHPHLMRVHDYGTDRSEGMRRPFYTAELVEGAPVAPGPRAERAIADAVSALHFLHTLGIRHGDFKPSNVLVNEAGRGVLVDLGCARRVGERGPLAGTPNFLAPELLAGRDGTAASDLFAVGVTLFALGLHAPLAARLVATDPRDRPGAEEVIEALTRAPAAFVAPPPAQGFHGRDEESARLRTWVRSLVDGKAELRLFRVVGARGIGVSRLLEEVRGDAQLELEVLDDRARPGAVRSLVARVLDVAPARTVLELLDQIDALDATPRLFVLDDADALNTEDRRDLLALARSIRCGLLVGTHDVGDAFLGFQQRDAFLGFQELAARFESIELRPLSREAVAAWTGETGERLATTMRETGGVPGEIEARSSEGSDPLETLPAPALALAVRLVARGENLQPSEEEWSAAETLIAKGVARRDGAELRRSSRVSSRALIAMAPAALRARARDEAVALHRGRVLASASDEERAIAQCEVVRTIARMDGAQAALRELAGSITILEVDARAAGDAARECMSAVTSTADRRVVAKALLAGGDGRNALRVLSRARRSAPRDADVLEDIAAALFAIGKERRASRYADAARSIASSPRLAALQARIALAAFDHRRALVIAEGALEGAASPIERARLLECAGLAASYVGEERAGRLLSDAATLFEREGRPRERSRSHAYLAIAAARRGDLEEALAENERALAISERHGLVDQLPTGFLNLGTTAHQRGDIAGAAKAYERGLRISAAIGHESTTRTIRLNLANLYAELGLFDRAERAALEVEQGAVHAAIPSFAAHAVALLGEIALGRGDLELAEQRSLRARNAYEAASLTREVAERDLVLAHIAVERGRTSDARALLAAIPAELAPDLALAIQLVSARVALGEGRAPTAVQALEALEKKASGWLAIDTQALLSRAFAAMGAHTLATSRATHARELLEKIAATLDGDLRAALLAHPKWRSLTTPPAEKTALPDLTRFFEVNRRINSSLSIELVFEAALDAAISLTGAERGFLLVANGPLSIAAARNLDREDLSHSRLALSRTIAEQVLSRGEAVVTVDARSDERFRENASVHAMKLTSVVCVPIRSPERVEGALYLDNRFERGRFGPGDIELLLAFADQVAVALVNARRNAALEERTALLEARSAELERERARVAELLAEKSNEVVRLANEVQAKQAALELRYDYSQIIGRSPPMQSVLHTLDRVMETNVSVLVTGESGTGKELVARALHFSGPRRDQPFVAVNCGALPASLLESELFGHVKGAFTGADRDRRGVFVAAHHGTLFLDEMGDLPLEMQAKLLRALQERVVTPLGSDKSLPVDVRVVCATHRDLEAEVEAERFREDLYYRIAVVTVRMPPLRERGQDVIEIANRVLERLAEKRGGPPKALGESAKAALLRHPFPGNVRELENMLVKADVLSDAPSLSARDLELKKRRVATPVTRSDFEREEVQRILDALRAAKWNVSAVAAQLGMPRNTLYRKLAKYGVKR